MVAIVISGADFDRLDQGSAINPRIPGIGTGIWDLFIKSGILDSDLKIWDFKLGFENLGSGIRIWESFTQHPGSEIPGFQIRSFQKNWARLEKQSQNNGKVKIKYGRTPKSRFLTFIKTFY